MVIVLALLAIALVVALVLWATIGRAGDPGAAGATTVSASPTTPAAPATPIAIAAVAAYDPEGNGEENDDLAMAALADGDPATVWRTVCYARSLMGDKPGVGLALTFAAPAAGTLSFDVGTAPFQVEVFASAADAVPPGFAEWGAAVADKVFSDQAGTVRVGVPDAGPPCPHRVPRARAVTPAAPPPTRSGARSARSAFT